ncbi:Protein kinase domain [Popillia japonica]|uniref:Protein kinase domain n=1 Tax=Popillia japonica TaxID=7064 RepID=A0AAW1ITN5_POPJA
MIKFTIETVRYYAAEILLASEVMNSQGVIHRDLKQKSILLGDNWHIVLKDFGCATILKEQRAMLRRRKNSFVGNTKYLRPKMQKPFETASRYVIYDKICWLDYGFSEGFNETAKDLVSIRDHEFFASFDDPGPPPMDIRKSTPTPQMVIISKNRQPGLDFHRVPRLQDEMDRAADSWTSWKRKRIGGRGRYLQDIA